MINHKSSSSGFALLLAIIMVSVVVSIGISVLDVTIKQLALSTNSRDSENAFHATNAGVECALYLRLKYAPELAAGDPITANCFGASTVTINSNPVSVSPPSTSGDAFTYTYTVSWPPGTPNRCTVMTFLVIASSDTQEAEVTNMSSIFPTYPYGSSKECPPGGICTVLSSQGFSRPCAAGTPPVPPSGVGTLQREILLEL